MRIALSAGHNVYVNNIFDPGAVGNGKRESVINKETVALLIPILRSQGHIVIDVTPYNEYYRNRQAHHEVRCKRVDEFNADIYLDIHINAGGGTGVEVWCHNPNSPSVPYATNISENIAKDMNLANRGVKYNHTYWSLYLTKKPAMIIEGAFIDNKADMDKLTPEKYAKAIAKAFGEVEDMSDILDRISNLEKRVSVLEGKKVESEKPKSSYYEIGDAKIIKTTPDNIYIAVLGDTIHGANVYGINGTFYDTDTAPVESPNSCVFIAMNDGKPISNNAQFNGWQAPARATMLYQKDELIGFRQLKDINPIRDIAIWAIGGYMVKPYMDFKNEKIPASVNYKTSHTYIGADDNGFIYLIVKPYHMISEIVPLLNMLNITKAVVLDGGGSSQLRHPEGGIISNRRINTAVLLKEV